MVSLGYLRPCLKTSRVLVPAETVFGLLGLAFQVATYCVAVRHR